MEHRDPPPVRRLVLVGFMGSGKSTVGRVVAQRLGWAFQDTDELVVERDGRSIVRIFDESGQPWFRSMEAQVTQEQLQRDQVVVATGGGWPVAPGRMEDVGPGTLTVWLDVPVSELVERLGRSSTERPLLPLKEPGLRIAQLAAEREAYYSRAAARVDGRGLPEAVADRILALMGSAPIAPGHTRTQD